jgi:hypothetical protein
MAQMRGKIIPISIHNGSHKVKLKYGGFSIHAGFL